jgi:hypothetical protein
MTAGHGMPAPAGLAAVTLDAGALGMLLLAACERLELGLRYSGPSRGVADHAEAICRAFAALEATDPVRCAQAHAAVQHWAPHVRPLLWPQEDQPR